MASLRFTAYFAASKDGEMDLKAQITTFFNDIKDIAKIVAPVMAFVGIIGAGVIYTGAALPIIGNWKGRP